MKPKRDESALSDSVLVVNATFCAGEKKSGKDIHLRGKGGHSGSFRSIAKEEG